MIPSDGRSVDGTHPAWRTSCRPSRHRWWNEYQDVNAINEHSSMSFNDEASTSSRRRRRTIHLCLQRLPMSVTSATATNATSTVHARPDAHFRRRRRSCRRGAVRRGELAQPVLPRIHRHHCRVHVIISVLVPNRPSEAAWVADRRRLLATMVM